MDERKGRQELYKGFGDTFTKGLEMVLTPALLGGMGYGIDRLAGLTPILTIVLTLLGVIGVGVKEYYSYEAEMRAQEAQAPWARLKAGR